MITLRLRWVIKSTLLYKFSFKGRIGFSMKKMPVIVLNLNSISMKSIFWISFNLFVAAVSKKKPFKDLDV